MMSNESNYGSLTFSKNHIYGKKFSLKFQSKMVSIVQILEFFNPKYPQNGLVCDLDFLHVDSH